MGTVFNNGDNVWEMGFGVQKRGKYWETWSMVGAIGEVLGIGFWVGEIVEMLRKPRFRVETRVKGGEKIGKLGFRVGKMEKYWRPWFRVGKIGENLGIGF